ncbi:GRAM domain-containing protein 2B-like isoform X2 [Gigantopelta aegis]|uniref:GRAM domain-containing protein 2B-like isoform X2 n=1 Tax=Gigantopelta aegis TaxID=1735272 RepID=UPI001B88A589|nr:GRAM domain-containing protein 2B-like isoform X2 [Gigantopelta aegis]
MDIVAGSINTTDNTKKRKSLSLVNSFKMLFRSKLSSDSKEDSHCDKNGNITRSKSFAHSRPTVDARSHPQLRRSMSTRACPDTSSKRCVPLRPLLTGSPGCVPQRTAGSKSESDDTGVHQHKDDIGSSHRSCAWQQHVPRDRQLLPIIASSEPSIVDRKISSSFLGACSAADGDNSQELQPRPSNEDVGIKSTVSKEMSRKLPLTNYLPHLSKSRCDKFHKLFKRVPEDEDPIDYYSCAFKGDILLHGFLYVSANWVCFYSKIKGRGRLLEINLEKVISITREKMALFIPNAIGIQTADKKYVFGSFMSRDTTFRLLVSLWRLSQDSETVTKVMEKGNHALILDHTLSTQSDSMDDDSDSSSMCLQCGPIDMGDRGDTVSDRTGHNFNKSCITSQNLAKEQRPSFYFIRCLDFRKICGALFHFAVKLQKIPRTSLMLAVCSILVFFLLISAICMTYKILLIQAKLELKSVWSHGSSYNDYVKGMIYAQEAGTHASVVNHLHSVLKSNIQLLEQIQSSLQSLYSNSGLKTCSEVDCP